MSAPRRRLGRVVAAVLSGVALVGVASEALATVDVSGAWGVQATATSGVTASDTCILNVGVAGSTLTVTGTCQLIGTVTLSGTVDTTTGAFSASGSSSTLCPTLSIAATSPDGKTFAGTFTCSFGSTSGTITGSRCGNGVLDPGEQCDDGFANGHMLDCCSATCMLEPATVRCREPAALCDAGAFCSGTSSTCPPSNAVPDGTSCTHVVCRADTCLSGTCVPHFTPSGTACDDQNACTLNDACDGAGNCGGTPRQCDDPCSVCVPPSGCAGPGEIALTPPNSQVASCEDRVAQSVAVLTKAIGKCHAALAVAVFNGQTFNEEACETTAESAYNAATNPLTGCPSCVQTKLGTIRDTLEQELDDQMADIFCAGTVPLGELDSATSAMALRPPDHRTLRCETRILKALAKYAKCETTCQIKKAAGLLTATQAENCEFTCAIQRGVAGCPVCLSKALSLGYAGGQFDDFNRVLNDLIRHLDCLNGEIYCASPSGAFLN